jgi:hypothetical protein
MQDETDRQVASEPCVWVSNAVVKSDRIFGFTCKMAEEDNDTLVARLRAFKRGEPLTSQDLPAVMWIGPKYAKDDRRKLPHLFNAGGFLAVSEPFAEVLHGFDLGRTRLHPVELRRSNREDRFPGRHHILNVAEVHRHFSPEHSARYQPVPSPKTSYIAGLPAGGLKDDDLTVAPAALAGPEIWLDDTIVSTLFFSDPLVRALRAAKLTSRLPLYRCRVAAAS